jgi:hypothetical protein
MGGEWSQDYLDHPLSQFGSKQNICLYKKIFYEIVTDSHFQQMTTKGGQNFAWRTKLNEFIDCGQKDTILTRDVFELAASSVLHSNTVLFPWERYSEITWEKDKHLEVKLCR